jgi:tetratricopeptide (TPR) repeat protein
MPASEKRRGVDALTRSVFRQRYGLRFAPEMVLAAALVLWQICAFAQASDDVATERTFLAREQFDRVEQIARQVQRRTNPSSEHALRNQIAGLDLELDSATIQRRLVEPGNGEKLEQRLALTIQLDGRDHSASLAKPLAQQVARSRLRLILGLDTSTSTQPCPQEALDRALTLVTQGDGKISRTDHAYVLEVAADCVADAGKFDQAVRYMREATSLLQKPRSPWERWSHASQLAGLASYLERTGEGTQARQIGNEAVTLAVDVAGKQSWLYASTLLTLGQIELFAGDFESARQALEIATTLFRQHAADVVLSSSLTVLANSKRHLGDYAGARSSYEEAIRILEKSPNPGQVRALPTRLHDLAMLERDVGDLEKARTLFERSLRMKEELFGPRHVSVVLTLLQLGDLARLTHALDQSQSYYERAAAIVKADPRSTATIGVYVQRDLAANALARGQPGDAERRLDQAIAMMTQSYGTQHPDLAILQCDRALALARLSRTREAFELARESEALRLDVLGRIAPALSASQSLNFKADLGSCTGLLLPLAERLNDHALTQAAWKLVAEGRGFTTRMLASRLEAARNAANPLQREKWARWQSAARVYADLVLRTGVAPAALAAAKAQLDKSEADLGNAALRLSAIEPGAAELDRFLEAPSSDSTLVAYVWTAAVDLDVHAQSMEANGRAYYAFIKLPIQCTSRRYAMAPHLTRYWRVGIACCARLTVISAN